MSKTPPVDTQFTHVDIETGNASPAAISLPPEPTPSKGILKPVPETTFAERIVGGVAIVAFGTALGAMIAELFEGLVVIAGLLSILMGGYAYYQETQLTDIRTLRQTRKAIQIEVDKLEAENKRLGKNIDEMEGTVQSLRDIEDALDKITKLQGKSVKAFAEQVQGYKQILAGMEQSLKGQIVSNIMFVISRGDTDRDFLLSKPEVDEMISRINALHGVSLNERKFREQVTDKPIHAAMSLVDNLFEEHIPQQDRIFIIEQKK